jgi:hypothetical protein
LAVVRKALRAYVDKDRAAIEAAIAPGYHFTSPIDNRLDRATYFARCWPNSEHTDSFREILAFEEGERAVVTYEAQAEGRRFRNCEVHTVRNGQLVETEVYFGWTLPHKAPAGGFVE